jgi:hypothetical protein
LTKKIFADWIIEGPRGFEKIRYQAKYTGITEELKLILKRNSSKVEMTEKNKYGWGSDYNERRY